MKYNDNGEYKDIYIKTFDTLPVGAIVEYNGATIPDGWTDLGNGKIEKTSQYIEGGTQIASYSTNEVNIGVKWIDGKDIYRKVLVFPNGTGQTTLKQYTLADYGITNVDTIFIVHPSYYSLGVTHYPFQYNDGTAFECNVNPTTLTVKLGYNQIANSEFVITLEYTKSS